MAMGTAEYPAVRQRILVVLEPHIENARLFRVAKRRAEKERIEWEVLVIRTPQMERRLSDADRENLLNSAHLASEMGAIVTTADAPSMVRGVLQHIDMLTSQHVGVFSLKLAEIKKYNPWNFFNVPLYKKLQKLEEKNLRIATVPLGFESRQWLHFPGLVHVHLRYVLYSLLAVMVATLCIELVQYIWPEIIGSTNRNMRVFYIIACAFAASRYGLLSALIASVASFVVYKLLYIPPFFSLVIADRSDAINLAIFIISAVIISLLGSRDFGSRTSLTKRVDRFNTLLKLHRLTLNKFTANDALKELDDALKRIINTHVVFFMPQIDNENVLEPIFHQDVHFTREEHQLLQLCWQESKSTGVGTRHNKLECRWRFEPLITARDEVGVLAVAIGKEFETDRDLNELIAAVADQTALILEHLHIGQQAEANKVQIEREKLRAMLLSSVSHDLKTPLASIIGSLSVYRSMGLSLPDEHRLTLINTAIDEAQRLDSFITNILDMTRIESGQIELKSEWVDPAQIVDDVIRRLRDRLRNHKLRVLTQSTNKEVSMDVMMTTQVLQNLLDNAVKYTPLGTQIDISWEFGDEGFRLYVRDHGKGIPEAQLESVFDKYSRIKRQDSQVAGTGLGLAIARAVMRAQGGDIEASNHPMGGAMFTLSLASTRISTFRSVA